MWEALSSPALDDNWAKEQPELLPFRYTDIGVRLGLGSGGTGSQAKLTPGNNRLSISSNNFWESKQPKTTLKKRFGSGFLHSLNLVTEQKICGKSHQKRF